VVRSATVTAHSEAATGDSIFKSALEKNPASTKARIRICRLRLLDIGDVIMKGYTEGGSSEAGLQPAKV
jgi:hypothetical protein